MTTTLEEVGAGVRDEPLTIADRTFRSRLIVGSGKYRDSEEMVRAIRAAGADMVTVAVRRVDLDASKEESLLHWLDPEEFFVLPNTAGCYTADEAIRYARLGRASGLTDWVKLEVIGDQATLLPDTDELLKATPAGILTFDFASDLVERIHVSDLAERLESMLLYRLPNTRGAEQ